MKFWDPKHRKAIARIMLVWGATFVICTAFLSVAPKNILAKKDAIDPNVLAELNAISIEGGACLPTNDPLPAYCVAEATEKWLTKFNQEILSPLLIISAITMMTNALQFFLDTLAYDAAVWIASGGEGNAPLFNGAPEEKVWQNFLLDTAGEAFYGVTQSLDQVGIKFNVCAPSADINFAISLGIRGVYSRPKPQCPWKDLQSNWQQFTQKAAIEKFDAGEYVLNSFAKSLKPGQTTLDASTSIFSKTFEEAEAKAKRKWMEAILADKRWTGVFNSITGQVQTPSIAIQKSFDEIMSKDREGAKEIWKVIGNESQYWQYLVAHVGSVFLNTLLSETIKNIKMGFFDMPEVEFNAFDFESVNISGREEASARYATMVKPSVPPMVSDYNIIAEFSVCPAGGSMLRQPNNCVMDTAFATAISRSEMQPGGMTVREALDEGLLHGDWPLFHPTEGPDGGVKNQDPFCYTYGYCYGNLVKLRKARIIPVGWELAANSEYNKNESVTLREVVDGFDKCGSDGSIDGTHPWCHLIDPNWVLKYPPTQCLAQTNSEMLINNFTAGRGTACVDQVSCLMEDDDGQCTEGYSYCTREKNIWRFYGDECPAHYASCFKFQNTDTSDLGFWLLNTLDFGTCNADNAGCLWYQTGKRFDDNGTAGDPTDDKYEWLGPNETYLVAGHDDDLLYYTGGNVSSPGSYSYTSNGNTYTYSTYAYQDRSYFDRNVLECTSADAGCSELYKAKDLSLNLVRNPSFEENEDGIPGADYWNEGGTPANIEFNILGAGGSQGNNSYYLTADGQVMQEGITLNQGTFYTMSFYGIDGDAGGAGIGRMAVALRASDNSEVSVAGLSHDCTRITDSGSDGTEDTFSLDSANLTAGPQSFECSFTTPILADPNLDLMAQVVLQGTDAYVDAVQIEPGAVPTFFHEGYSSDPIATYIKVAPDYLGCTGGPGDVEACGSYAHMCSAINAGCELYTPVTRGPSVPAVISDIDRCPAECVGYTTYKQSASRYDIERFPLYFIADTAAQCTAEHVGCDEFTNLETEAVETYSYLRACVPTDDPNAATYFTWEGSDQAGYQLVSWQLLKSNRDNAPCTFWSTNNDNIVCTDNISYVPPANCSSHDNIFSNPDCREFFDQNGNIHYRQWSDTVTVTDECVGYRKGGIDETGCESREVGGFFTPSGECKFFGYADESRTCPETYAGCREYTGGTGRNSVTIFNDEFEDGDVVGFTTGNATISISNESIATGGHSVKVDATASNGQIRTIAKYLNSGNHNATYDIDTASTCTSNGGIVGSYGCDFDTDGDSVTDCTVPDGDNSCGTLNNQLIQGKTYILRFWAKGTDDIEVAFADEAGSGQVHDLVDLNDTDGQQGVVDLNGTWRLYELGPFDTSAIATFDDTSILAFAISGGTANSEFYLDNIQLIQTEENIALIKDSWVTPSTCDTSPNGADAPQYFLGCEEYKDRDQSSHYIYQFSRLCSDSDVGCELFYQSHNSESPYSENYNLTCYHDDNLREASSIVNTTTRCEMDGHYVCNIPPGANQCSFNWDMGLPPDLDDNIAIGPGAKIVPNDTVVAVIENGNASCNSANVGCKEVGLPKFSQDRTIIESFESKYLIDDPDSYDQILCSHSDLFCQEWQSTKDGNFYFKNPDRKACEYKTGITIENEQYSGWFRTDTTEFCYGIGECDDGSQCTVDSQCAAIGQGTCKIVQGTYLRNGVESGIWANGDSEYDGWAGVCNAASDLCTEFVDPLDTAENQTLEGKSYFYLDNDLLDDGNVDPAKQCHGMASLELGCSLFRDKVETSLLYSASPSYIASERADILFGDAPGSLQSPISCPDGGEIRYGDNRTIDLCVSRCLYKIKTGDRITDEIVEEGHVGANMTNYWGRSCVVNEDCPVVRNPYGVPITGRCVNDPATDPDLANDNGVEFKNDTNLVKKVYRDRACAEWLYCETTLNPVWDEQTQTYRKICGDVKLCTEVGPSGALTSCNNQKHQDPVALDAEKYSQRDTSWYGLEYSGFTIPGVLPIEHLEQININPEKACFNSSGELVRMGGVMACSSSNDCAEGNTCRELEEKDYRLGYKGGACGGTHGSPCVIGFCSQSRKECTEIDDSACDEGDDDICMTGYCIAKNTNLPACVSDSDCTDATYNTCVSGVCTNLNLGSINNTPNGECFANSDCNSTGDPNVQRDCNPQALKKTGLCYSSYCISGVDGKRIRPATAEGKECRGYPENSSPFPTEIVTGWVKADNRTADPVLASKVNNDPGHETEYIPSEYVYGYDGVQTCSPTKNEGLTDGCVCSYDKAEFGEGAYTKYYPLNTGFGNIPDGICVGGSKNGMPCTGDTGCNTAPETGNTCMKATSKESRLGWLGICLERDTSVFKNGQQDEHPCLTWFPIDQLMGAVNPFAQYPGSSWAGQYGDYYYCTEVGYYRDYYVTGAYWDGSDITKVKVSCAKTAGDSHNWSEIEAENIYKNSNDHKEYEDNQCNAHEYQSCYYNAWCPDGYIALIGYCNNEQTDCDGDAENNCAANGVICTEQWDENIDQFGGSDDGNKDSCPYFCVPMYSYKYDTGEKCDVTQSRVKKVSDLLADARQEGVGTTDGYGTDSRFRDIPRYNPLDTIVLNDIKDNTGATFYTGNHGGNEFEVSRYGTPFVLVGRLYDKDTGFDSGDKTIWGAEVDKYKRCAVRGIPSTASYGWDYMNNAPDTNTLDNSNSPWNLDTDHGERIYTAVNYIDTCVVPPCAKIERQKISTLDIEWNYISTNDTQRFRWANFYQQEYSMSPYWIWTKTHEDSQRMGSFYIYYHEYQPGGDGTGSIRSYLGCYEVTKVIGSTAKPWTNRLNASFNGNDSFTTFEGSGAVTDYEDIGVSYDYAVDTPDQYAGAIPFREYYHDYGDPDGKGDGVKMSVFPDKWPMTVESCELDWLQTPSPLNKNVAPRLVTAPIQDNCTQYRYPTSMQYTVDDPNSPGTLLNRVLDGDEGYNLALPYEDLDDNGIFGDADQDAYKAYIADITPEEYQQFGGSMGYKSSIYHMLSQFYARPLDNTTELNPAVGGKIFRYKWYEVDDFYAGSGPSIDGKYEAITPNDYWGYAGHQNSPDVANEGLDISHIGDSHGDPRTDQSQPINTRAPTIWAVGDCDVATQKCEESQEGYFSVNGEFNEDVYGNSIKTVSVKFFAAADSNHMPIKRVVVDWGAADKNDWGTNPLAWPSDNIGDTPNNQFRNQRGQKIVGSELVDQCGSSDEFGLLSNDQCDSAYFNFSNDYVCDVDMVEDLRDEGRICEFQDPPQDHVLKNSPCVGDGEGFPLNAAGACVYQPRVHVQDNWGWCTGYCPGDPNGRSADETDGCYNGTDIDYGYDECNIDYCPSEGTDSWCDDYDDLLGTSFEGTINPWINYRGLIIIAPGT